MKKSLLCLVLTENTLERNIELIQHYQNYIDIVELRADFLTDREMQYIKRFPALVDMPVILTLRRQADGGKFQGSEAERRNLLKKSIVKAFSYLDLESDFRDTEFEADVKRLGIRIIRSFHDFNGVPGNITKRIKDMAREQGVLPKAAVMPKSSKDLFRLLRCFKKLTHIEKIIVGMGEYGLPTRILSNYLGSFLSYCSKNKNLAAPGNKNPEEMVKLYGFHKIDSTTKIYGIIGNPIMHSFSPLIHNKGFKALEYNGVYIPFLVDKVKQFFKTAKLLNIRGLSVTIPHKQAVIRFLSTQHTHISKIKACNTIIRKADGYYGENTDVYGFLKPLKNYFGDPLKQNIKATVIGAGGAARAVVYGLREHNAHVLILNRTLKKARQLAQAFNCEWGGLDKDGIKRIRNYSDLIVQTTSVGMEPHVEKNPIASYRFKGHEIVYDLIYNPPLTKILEKALNNGCKVINGEEMLLAQAGAQFQLFTGSNYFFPQSSMYDILHSG
ncbi:MAG: shikimate dehydrogenase [Spirochaetales bacterium]|nr:shikimate dehydrogenase [Spirochaetales bacterium]